jgi:hypothetical protein
MSDLPLNAYVELRQGFESVYDTEVFAGCRGWIRATKKDDYDFEKVYIVWDREHWRYNGQEDVWTFPNHFQLVSTDKDIVEDIHAPASPPSEEEEWEGRIKEYLDLLMDAFDRAAEADGFYLITMRRGYDPDLGIEIIALDPHRGAVDDELQEVSGEAILGFMQEQLRRRDL